jgi:hypothetical protein
MQIRYYVSKTGIYRFVGESLGSPVTKLQVTGDLLDNDRRKFSASIFPDGTSGAH